ncbi:type VII secretion protein EsaA [Bacillus massiliglaciei]|uniref:type VII secretion protein EsaA n=1 Tax=Bacillus massiliglaciei TaxID=1816693 RepID=UPI000ABDBD3C|nr:type VII secretion protein EsaA [Bacillus massiliglaciei]
MAGKGKALSLLVKILIIIVMPIAFFSYIGQNPMKRTDPATREIAIVNEDNGAVMDDKEIEFGKEVAGIFGTNSEYNWYVVNRSTAENGLAGKRYDAVVYLPSDFSSNILTFNEDRPVKAGVQYEIQPDLNAENVEKVQKELEKTKNKMNKSVSTMYWSYVSQSVDDIRKKFDNILEKEIAFQTTMYQFYTPSSEKLAGEIEQHKKMLEGAFASTKQAGSTSQQTLGEMDQIKADVSQFVDSVEAFQKYQQTQSDMFQLTSAENKQLLQNSMKQYTDILNSGASAVPQFQQNTIPTYSYQQEGSGRSLSLNEKVSLMKNGIRQSSQNLSMFSDQLKATQNQKISEISENQRQAMASTTQFETDNLNVFQAMLAENRKNVEVPPDPPKTDDPQTDPENGEEPEGNKPGMDPGEAPDDKEVSGFNSDELLAKIASLKEELSALTPPAPAPGENDHPGENEGEEEAGDAGDGEAGDGTEPGAEPEIEPDQPSVPNPFLGIIGSLNELSERISEMTNDHSAAYQSLAGEYNELNEKYRTLLEEYDLLSSEYDKLDGRYTKEKEEAKKAAEEAAAKIEDLQTMQKMTIDEMVEKIEGKEAEVLAAAEGPRREQLQNLFSHPILTRDSEKLIDYYGMLSSYGEMKDNVKQSQEKRNELFAASFAAIEKYQADFPGFVDNGVGPVKDGISANEQDFETFAGSVSDFISLYDQNVQKEHQAIMDELNAITSGIDEVSANLMTNTKDPETDPAPVDGLDGSLFVSMQDSTAASVSHISEMVASVGERQDQVTEYTGELQTKVGTVQQRADQLNANWAQNVDSTKKVKTDVYSVLHNTVVDDQQNDYVYDYLANPVQLSGDVLQEESVNLPPIVMLVIVLISGLLIGFFLHHYSAVPVLVHSALFLLLNLIVGLIISIYGLKIYPLEDIQAIKWTVFTTVLLFFCSAVTRLAFYIGPFIGSLLVIAMIAFFTMPLLDLILPNFSVDHPIADMYMDIQFNTASSYAAVTAGLAAAAILAGVLPYILGRLEGKRESAHEAE